MKTLLEKSRYSLLAAVVASLLASFVSLGWGIYKTIGVISTIVGGSSKGSAVSVAFIEVMDTFLIAAVLYIFAVAIYELFVGDLELPQWLAIHDLVELKAKVTNVIILVLVIAFAEHFVEWTDAESILRNGIAAAVVISALALFNRFDSNHHNKDEDKHN